MVEFVDFSVLAIQLAVVVFLVESVTEIMKAVLKNKVELTGKREFYIALSVGIVSSILLKISLFETTNLVMFYVGCVLAGAISSRGANHMHDILRMIASLRKK